MRRREEHAFARVSGGIVTEHFLSLMQDEKHGFEYARPETFVRPWREEDLPPQDEAQFLAQVRDVWERLLRRFDEKFRDIWAGRMGAEEVRRLWQRPVLDALGFEPTSTTKQIVISDRLKYRFSHRGWFAREGIPKPPVIHILPPGTDPDARPSRGEPSPHDALQDCLNRHDATWAVLMNETVIRILRDYHHTTVPGYVEFDLEGIFLNRSFPEFLALYRLCHASRFVRDPASGKEPLEEYYEVSRQAGEKIGESLRVNVVQAIEEFGNGFLDGALIERLRGDDGACRAYYQEVLMVVYRIIFMLFAEQRGMLGGGGDHGDLFLEEYSITSLRERVDAFEGRDDRNTDLWEGLSVTFRMLEEGVPELGVNAFDGMLFSNDGARFLKDAKCRNTALMNAIRSLTWTVPETGGRRQRGHGRQRISYADLSVEEIGAIYESLLDYTPRITTGFEEVEGREYRPGQFMLDPRGSERKESSSYYTTRDLIAELIKSALDPVIADRLSRAGPDPAAREKALLSIRVCDPACGSGAFLIAASNRLGRELAKIRAGTELPSAVEMQAARRDVLSHCIYGVDLNPMAVELAKVSLWINALVGDKPLSFLDHHIKCGNSLIGATPELIAGGIPDDAYTPVEGDSKEVAKRIKVTNKEQRQTRTFEEFSPRSTVLEACARRFAALADASEDDPDSVEAKKAEYKRLIASSEYAKERLAADCWCAAFFWPLDAEHAGSAPTTATVRMVQTVGGGMFIEDMLDEVRRIAKEHRFFHWHLEFPEVFAGGGFDCVLGNPPWDMINVNSDEFFSKYLVDFRRLSNKQKGLKINEICSDRNIHNAWIKYKSSFPHLISFFKDSNLYKYQGKGHLNTFKLFLEKYYTLSSNDGYFGIIIPSGIYNDEGCKELRELLLKKSVLKSLFGFENKKKIFPIDSRFKFVLLVATKGGETERFSCGFMLHDFDELHALEAQGLSLRVDLIKKLSPDTQSIMEFFHQGEINLMEKLYSHHPTLGQKLNTTWNVTFHRELHVSEDNHLFQDYLSDFPVYEGKMIHQFNHRFAPPRFWIKKEDINILYPDKDQISFNSYRLAFRAVASNTNETTLICTILPKYTASVHSLMVLDNTKIDTNPQILLNEQIYLASLLNSFCVNYIIRKKVTSNVSIFHVYQLPCPRIRSGNWFFEQILARAARLVCTTEEYADLWTDIYSPGWNELSYMTGGISALDDWVILQAKWSPDFGIQDGWDDAKHDIGRRAQLRCEIDALVAHLYRLERSELESILSTFPAVNEKAPWIIEGILKEFDKIKEFLQSTILDATQSSSMDVNLKPDWRALIAGGESERVEFKESISWDRGQKQRNKALEHTIARTIASFMNTHGGVLFVGVDDAGTIVGLDGDLKLSQRKNEDGLRLRFDDLVKQFLGNRFLPGIMIHSLEDSGKVFWAVEVRPTSEPVFVKNNGDDEFWIRGTSSSRKLSMREAVEYIERRKSGGAGDPNAGE